MGKQFFAVFKSPLLHLTIKITQRNKTILIVID